MTSLNGNMLLRWASKLDCCRLNLREVAQRRHGNKNRVPRETSYQGWIATMNGSLDITVEQPAPPCVLFTCALVGRIGVQT